MGDVPALVVVFDAAVILAPHYIQTMPEGCVAENDLVRYLKREVGHNRTAMATKDGFYNFWLTYLFPYQGIPSIEVTQLPRPPADFVAFWNAVQDPVRMWQLAAVSHVLAHGPVAAQLLANPAWAAQLDMAWAYQPMDDGRGGVAVRSVAGEHERAGGGVEDEEDSAAHRRRFLLARGGSADTRCRRWAIRRSFRFRRCCWRRGTKWVRRRPGEPGPPAEVEIAKAIPGRYEFAVKNHRPVVLRVAEKFDPNWKATVDGKSVRVDFLFRGLALEEAGTHEIAMRYAPSLPIALQWIGIAASLGAAVVLALSSAPESGGGVNGGSEAFRRCRW